MRFRVLSHRLCGLFWAALTVGIVLIASTAATAAPKDVKVTLADDSGSATVAVERTGKYELRIDIAQQTVREAVTLQVELPIAGAAAWPVACAEFMAENAVTALELCGDETT